MELTELLLLLQNTKVCRYISCNSIFDICFPNSPHHSPYWPTVTVLFAQVSLHFPVFLHALRRNEEPHEVHTEKTMRRDPKRNRISGRSYNSNILNVNMKGNGKNQNLSFASLFWNMWLNYAPCLEIHTHTGNRTADTIRIIW